jgi:hypothetical protein
MDVARNEQPPFDGGVFFGLLLEMRFDQSLSKNKNIGRTRISVLFDKQIDHKKQKRMSSF